MFSMFGNCISNGLTMDLLLNRNVAMRMQIIIDSLKLLEVVKLLLSSGRILLYFFQNSNPVFFVQVRTMLSYLKMASERKGAPIEIAF